MQHNDHISTVRPFPEFALENFRQLRRADVLNFVVLVGHDCHMVRKARREEAKKRDHGSEDPAICHESHPLEQGTAHIQEVTVKNLSKPTGEPSM